MGRRINILILSNRKIWCQSLAVSVASMAGRFAFFTEEDGDNKITAVLIDTQGWSRNIVKRKIEKYWNFPVFVINAERQSKNIIKNKNIMGVFSGTVAIRTIFKAIKITLDEAKVSKTYKGQLTAAEEVILDGLVKGYSNKQIAGHYGINLSKVKYHLQRIYQKLKVKNRVQAALIADQIVV